MRSGVIRGACSVALATMLAGNLPAAAGAPADEERLSALEVRLVQEPANLRVGAEYRQLVIATRAYDRSLRLFQRLARDPRGGANRYLNLALACVDKVPVSGSIRQALLGRDAIDAASRAIAIEPTPVAYFIRGLVNLYYDRAIFHRTDKGVADLEEARKLAARSPELPLVRLFVALGDGYWKLHRRDQARDAWREGARRAPDSEGLRARLAAPADQIAAIVEHALDPNVRVDTTLGELFPDQRAVASTPPR